MGQAVGDHPPRTVELEAVGLGRVDDGELPGPDQRPAAALLGGAGARDLQVHEDVGTVGAGDLPDPVRGPLRLGGDPRPHDPVVRAGLDPAAKALDGAQRRRRERYEGLADDFTPVPELLTRGTDRHIPHRHAEHLRTGRRLPGALRGPNLSARAPQEMRSGFGGGLLARTALRLGRSLGRRLHNRLGGGDGACFRGSRTPPERWTRCGRGPTPRDRWRWPTPGSPWSPPAADPPVDPRGHPRPRRRAEPPARRALLDERRESIPQRGRVLLAQVDLVGLSVQTERHRFGRFAAVEVIEQPDFCDLCHLLLSILARAEGMNPP